MPWGSADACWERVSSIFGHPSVPGEGRFNVFPCVFCLTWTAAAWPTGVHTRWPQEEGICPTFLSCWVRSQLSGCVQIAVLLPSALQVGAGGSRAASGLSRGLPGWADLPWAREGCSRFQSAFCSSPGAAYSGRAHAGNSSSQR